MYRMYLGCMYLGRMYLGCMYLQHPPTWSPPGSFEGITHIARLLDRTRSGAMRHTMLQLLERLLIPAAAQEQMPAQRAARANGQV